MAQYTSLHTMIGIIFVVGIQNHFYPKMLHNLVCSLLVYERAFSFTIGPKEHHQFKTYTYTKKVKKKHKIEKGAKES